MSNGRRGTYKLVELLQPEQAEALEALKSLLEVLVTEDKSIKNTK